VVVYDVAGLGEPVRAFGAGRVVPAGDIDAFTEAVRELLNDPSEARAGAERARAALTWDASAAMHLDLYRELV
jgi:glycosyltransferase involved in cell wall biosynthesis